eukprot:GHVS01019224.1.p1 GENE.GHVS01019224.1~~GHVS01019224.1.p1  ORF type:complete len:946 (+),score=276.78 GHVS01019224.1:571-3408(+)
MSSSVSESALDAVESLLRPSRHDGWDVDVGTVLGMLLECTGSGAISMENTQQSHNHEYTLDYVQAARILEKSTKLYGQKIDQLRCAVCKLIENDNDNTTEENRRGGRRQTGDVNQQTTDQTTTGLPLLCIPSLTLGRQLEDISSSQFGSGSGNTAVAVVMSNKRVPLFLMPREGSDKNLTPSLDDPFRDLRCVCSVIMEGTCALLVDEGDAKGYSGGGSGVVVIDEITQEKTKEEAITDNTSLHLLNDNNNNNDKNNDNNNEDVVDVKTMQLQPSYDVTEGTEDNNTEEMVEVVTVGEDNVFEGNLDDKTDGGIISDTTNNKIQIRDDNIKLPVHVSSDKNNNKDVKSRDIKWKLLDMDEVLGPDRPMHTASTYKSVPSSVCGMSCRANKWPQLSLRLLLPQSAEEVVQGRWAQPTTTKPANPGESVPSGGEQQMGGAFDWNDQRAGRWLEGIGAEVKEGDIVRAGGMGGGRVKGSVGVYGGDSKKGVMAFEQVGIKMSCWLAGVEEMIYMVRKEKKKQNKTKIMKEKGRVDNVWSDGFVDPLRADEEYEETNKEEKNPWFDETNGEVDEQANCGYESPGSCKDDIERAVEMAQGTYEAVFKQHNKQLAALDPTANLEPTQDEMDIHSRVKEWNEFLEPQLAVMESQPEFKINTYKKKVLSAVFHHEKREASFEQVVRGLPRYDVCRTFVTALTLLNQKKIGIVGSDGKEQDGDGEDFSSGNFQLRLLGDEKEIEQIPADDDDEQQQLEMTTTTDKSTNKSVASSKSRKRPPTTIQSTTSSSGNNNNHPNNLCAADDISRKKHRHNNNYTTASSTTGHHHKQQHNNNVSGGDGNSGKVSSNSKMSIISRDYGSFTTNSSRGGSSGRGSSSARGSSSSGHGSRGHNNSSSSSHVHHHSSSHGGGNHNKSSVAGSSSRCSSVLLLSPLRLPNCNKNILENDTTPQPP